MHKRWTCAGPVALAILKIVLLPLLVAIAIRIVCRSRSYGLEISRSVNRRSAGARNSRGYRALFRVTSTRGILLSGGGVTSANIHDYQPRGHEFGIYSRRAVGKIRDGPPYTRCQ